MLPDFLALRIEYVWEVEGFHCEAEADFESGGVVLLAYNRVPVKQGVYKIVQYFEEFGGEGGFQFFVKLVLFFVEPSIVFPPTEAGFF